MSKTALLALMATFVLAGTTNAATLYQENFDGQDGQGAIGANVDTSAVDWSLDLGAANLFNGSDYAAVEDARFAFQDTNAGCSTSTCPERGAVPAIPTWMSPVISIAGYTNLMLGLDYGGASNFEFDGGINEEDDFIVSVLIDSVETVVLDAITQDIASFSDVLNAALNMGSQLQIKVAANTYAGSEKIWFDNVTVTGDMAVVTPVPLPASALLLGAGLAGFAGLRRRKS